MALTAQQKAVLDLVGTQLHVRELWTSGRELRSRMGNGTNAEKTAVLDALVPTFLVRDGQPLQERYRFTLEGAFESNLGHAVGQYLRELLDAVRVLGARNPTFDQYSIDTLRRNSDYLAATFPDDYRWLDNLIRISGLCSNDSPEGGPWRVPDEIETVLECQDVQALRRLRRGEHYDPSGRVMDPKVTFGLEDVHIALLDRIAEYELEHAELTPINHALLAEPPERENELHERLAVLAAKDCIEITGLSGPELLPLRPWGLLGSKCAARADAMIRRLLSYFRDRLSAEGVNFKQFTWENLKAAGVVADDSEFSWFVRLIHLLRLANGSTHSLTQAPTARWDVPRDIAQLRGVDSIGDLLLLDSFKPRERSAAPRLAERDEASPSKETTMTADPKKVFIIHGRNIAARTQMGIFVRSLGLQPINFGDLRASMGGTPTISEIVERGMSEAQGVIALITADEYAAVRPEYREDHDEPDQIARWQARPNVIFEAGMAFGRDRTRVVFVLLGNPKLFTDVAGIHVLRPTNDPSGDRGILRSTLGQGMHCHIELHSSDWMKAGDFEGCVLGAPSGGPADPFAPAGSEPPTRASADPLGLSPDARSLFDGLRELYRKNDYPNHKTWNFSPKEGQRAAFAELRAHRLIETMGTGETRWRLTDEGQRALLDKNS